MFIIQILDAMLGANGKVVQGAVDSGVAWAITPMLWLLIIGSVIKSQYRVRALEIKAAQGIDNISTPTLIKWLVVFFAWIIAFFVLMAFVHVIFVPAILRAIS